MKIRHLVFALALVPALSQAAILTCNGCNEPQRQSAAVSMGPGDHYVVDFPHGMLRRYYVECVGPGTLGVPEDSTKDKPKTTAPSLSVFLSGHDLAWNGCRGQTYVSQLPNGAWAEDIFDFLVEVWAETGGTWAKRVIIDAGGLSSLAGDSAFALTWDGVQRDRLVAYIARNISNVGVWEFAQRAFVSVATGGALHVTYTVRYPDGSLIEVHCSYETERCDYVPGSARDPDGQRIFDGVSTPLTGNYHLGDNWLQRWIDNAWAHGIPVVYGGAYTPRRMRCEMRDGRFECVGY